MSAGEGKHRIFGFIFGFDFLDPSFVVPGPGFHADAHRCHSFRLQPS